MVSQGLCFWGIRRTAIQIFTVTNTETNILLLSFNKFSCVLVPAQQWKLSFQNNIIEGHNKAIEMHIVTIL